jgi:hypothetical protein
MHPPDDVVPPASGPPEHVSSWAQVAETACETVSSCSVVGDCVPQPTTNAASVKNARTKALYPRVVMLVLPRVFANEIMSSVPASTPARAESFREK